RDPLPADAREDDPADHALPRRGGAALRPRRRPPRGRDRRDRSSGGALRRVAADGDPVPPRRRGGRRLHARADARPPRADRGGARRGLRARGAERPAADPRGDLPGADRGPRMSLFVHQLRAEQRLYWRSRELAFFTFLFPLLLFVLLDSVYG